MPEQTQRPLAAYYAGIRAALEAHDIKAIPGLLVWMSLDGYGHEAEQLRREILLLAAVEPGKRGADG